MALIDYILGPKRTRAKTVERDGSPVFLYSFGALAVSGGREYVELRTDIPSSRKYEPLDVIDITNTSGAALTLEINGSQFGLIAPNFFFSLTEQSLWSVALVNNTTSPVTAGSVTARMQRAARTMDNVAAEL